MPPKSRICRRGDVVAGMVGEARVEHLRDRVVRAQHLARSPARSRSAAPCAPRASSRRAARGSSRTATAPRPSRSAGTAPRRRARRRSTATNPPTTSECPPRYFVLECTDESAPSASGCCRYGVANVLSTTTRALARVRELRRPLRCRRSTAAGFVGVSIHTRRGLVAPRGFERGRVAEVDRGPRDAVALVHARDEPERAAVRVGRG